MAEMTNRTQCLPGGDCGRDIMISETAKKAYVRPLLLKCGKLPAITGFTLR
jgi:hypothetical protein